MELSAARLLNKLTRVVLSLKMQKDAIYVQGQPSQEYKKNSKEAHSISISEMQMQDVEDSAPKNKEPSASREEQKAQLDKTIANMQAARNKLELEDLTDKLIGTKGTDKCQDCPDELKSTCKTFMRLKNNERLQGINIARARGMDCISTDMAETLRIMNRLLEL